MAPLKRTITLENFILQIQSFKASGSFTKAIQQMEGENLPNLVRNWKSVAFELRPAPSFPLPISVPRGSNLVGYGQKNRTSSLLSSQSWDIFWGRSTSNQAFLIHTSSKFQRLNSWKMPRIWGPTSYTQPSLLGQRFNSRHGRLRYSGWITHSDQLIHSAGLHAGTSQFKKTEAKKPKPKPKPTKQTKNRGY